MLNIVTSNSVEMPVCLLKGLALSCLLGGSFYSWNFAIDAHQHELIFFPLFSLHLFYHTYIFSDVGESDDDILLCSDVDFSSIIGMQIGIEGITSMDGTRKSKFIDG